MLLYMKASVVDLRYKMNDVLKALERGEAVTVLHRGKAKGTIVPANSKATLKVEDHPFFGSRLSESSVDKLMDELRAPRHPDV